MLRNRQLRDDPQRLSLIRRSLDQPLAATRYEQNSWMPLSLRGVGCRLADPQVGAQPWQPGFHGE
jgi:hypothetical protein